MRRLTTYLTTAAVAGVLALGAISAASAQTWSNGWDNGWNNQGYQSSWNNGWDNGWRNGPMVTGEVSLNGGAGSYGYGTSYYGSGYDDGLTSSPVAGRGYTPPGTSGYGYGCVTDEGYGRTQPCDKGGGF